MGAWQVDTSTDNGTSNGLVGSRPGKQWHEWAPGGHLAGSGGFRLQSSGNESGANPIILVRD